MGEPRDPSDTRRDFQNTNSSSGTHASANQRKATSLSTNTSAPSPPSPDERGKNSCAANETNTRATNSNPEASIGYFEATRGLFTSFNVNYTYEKFPIWSTGALLYIKLSSAYCQEESNADPAHSKCVYISHNGDLQFTMRCS